MDLTARRVVAIGVARTPWSRGNCPKNQAAARERGGGARLVIVPEFRAGLAGLDGFTHLHLIGLFDGREQPVPMLQKPSHLDTPRGVFALRSPARPNPIALSIARIEALDVSEGIIRLDALDWFDGTPLLDMKPYYPSTDCWPDAGVPSSPKPFGAVRD